MTKKWESANSGPGVHASAVVRVCEAKMCVRLLIVERSTSPVRFRAMVE
jgi:hypothetical protein